MDMNSRIVSFIGLILTASVLAGCQQLERQDLSGGADGDTVTIEMSFSLPEDATPATKALTDDTPEIRNLYVAVFGMNHYLNDFVKAVPLTTTGDVATGYVPDGDGKYRVRIILSQNSTKRYVHVVANVDEANIPDFGYENDFMDQLPSDAEGDAFWQYLEFPSGINNATKSAFNNIFLVRNFAKISFQISSALETKYTLKGFQVYNRPSRGVYPVMTGVSGSGDHLFSKTYASSSFHDLMGASYGGYRAPSATLLPDSVPASFDDDDPDSDPLTWASYESYEDTDNDVLTANAKVVYMYENPVGTDATTTFIIAKLEPVGSTGTYKYFRIDIEDAEKNRLPILRNFFYTITLNDIDAGVTGYSTASEAAVNPFNFNVTTNPVTASVPEIRNGVALMETNYVEKVFVSASGDETFKYRYQADAASHPGVYMAGTVSVAAGAVLPGITILSVNSNEGGGWNGVHFSVTDPATLDYGGAGSLESVFTIQAGSGKTMIERTVKIISMPKQYLAYTTGGDPTYNSGTKKLSFTLHIPAGLHRSMFPLIFVFQDRDQVMSPDGSSLMTGYTTGSSPKVIFKRYLRYANYNSASGTDITVSFKAPVAPTQGIIDITEENGFFNDLVINYSAQL